MSKTDTITGIDRYEHSPDRGKLVVEAVILWRRPGIEAAAEHVTGAVAHGDEVEVLRTVKRDGGVYARVKTDKYPNRQSGWMRATLLEKLGLDEPGIKGIEAAK